MNKIIYNTFLLALREIKRNILRSFLTVLGIVIGVAAVITLVTIGSGATAQVTEQIASLGNNMLIIRAGKRMGPPDRTSSPDFSMADVEAIANEVPSVKAVMGIASSSVIAINGSDNWETTVTGTNNAFFQIRNWDIAEGRQFEEEEIQGGRSACIIGATIQKELYGGLSPVGESLRLGSFSCNIVGLLTAKGQSTMGEDQDDIILMPLKTVQRRLTGNKYIRMIQLSVKETASTDNAISSIKALMRERRHIDYNEDDNFDVMDMKEIATMMTSTTKVLTALLAAVAAVSLLVGGIGIMNIMLVSVTERTREIGIRLAIGALENEVLLQFLVEAAVLSGMGGVIGIVLALVASYITTIVIGVPFVFEGGIVALAFIFSVAVGLIFGYFPAVKAARLDPIDSLRHE